MKLIKDLLYFILRTFASVVGHMFFKEIHIIGKENLPKDGPVVLCGTHNSQYVDAMMMVLSSARPVNFLVAEKSTRHSILKYFVKLMHVVPVTRAIDKKIKGKGKLAELNVTDGELYGDKVADFVGQVNKGDMVRIVIKVEADPLPHVFLLPVLEVLEKDKLKVKISDAVKTKFEGSGIFEEVRTGVYKIDNK